MADSIQALANEVARLNRSSTLWAQPQVQPQTSAAAVMTQPQPQMQDYMMQQYAYANPGSMSPGHMFADPRAANYALQQQHFMNPYQARFYGGQFGDNLPGAEFHTSSRLGLYREGYTGPRVGGFVEPSFIRDTMTLTGLRSYAGYESPYHAQVDATRRMYERGESAINVGTTIGAIGLGLKFATVPAALGIFGAEMAFQATAGNYFQRRRETGEVSEIMRDLVSGAAATGVFGRGVGLRTASEMVSSMRTTAAADPFHSIQDYKEILRTGAATGLFNYEDTGGEVTNKVKTTAKMLNMMMMLAEDPDIQSTIKRMADFQAMGIPVHQMERMASDIKGYAHLANASFEEVMSQGASAGAQQAQMMGGSAAFGMRIGAMTMGMANRSLQSGFFSPNEAARRGGKSGIAQSARTGIISHLDMITGIGAAMLMDEEGNYDPSKYGEFMNTNINDLINKSQTSFNKMHYAKYMLGYGDTKAAVQAQMPMVDIFKKLDDYRDDWMKTYDMTKDEYYLAMGGESGGKIWKYMDSPEFRLSKLGQEQQVIYEKGAKRLADERSANLIINRALTGWSKFTNWMGNWDWIHDSAEAQDRMTRWNAGIVYRNTDDPIRFGFDKTVRQHFTKQRSDLVGEIARQADELSMEVEDDDQGYLSRLWRTITLRDPAMMKNKGLQTIFQSKFPVFDPRTTIKGLTGHRRKPWLLEENREQVRDELLQSGAIIDQFNNAAIYETPKNMHPDSYEAQMDATRKETRDKIITPLGLADKERLDKILTRPGAYYGTGADQILNLSNLTSEERQLVLRGYRHKVVDDSGLSNLVKTIETARENAREDVVAPLYEERSRILETMGLDTEEVKAMMVLRAQGMSYKDIIENLKTPKSGGWFTKKGKALQTLIKRQTAEDINNMNVKDLERVEEITGLSFQKNGENNKELQKMFRNPSFYMLPMDDQTESIKNVKGMQNIITDAQAKGLIVDQYDRMVQGQTSDSDIGTNIASMSKNTVTMKDAIVSLAANFGKDSAFWEAKRVSDKETLSKVFITGTPSTGKANYVISQ